MSTGTVVKRIVIDILIMALYLFGMFVVMMWYGATGPDGSIIGLSALWKNVRNYGVPAVMICLPLIGTFLTLHIYIGKRRKMHIGKQWIVMAVFKVVVFLAPAAWLITVGIIDGFGNIFDMIYMWI